jgi:hypothetical protein
MEPRVIVPDVLCGVSQWFEGDGVAESFELGGMKQNSDTRARRQHSTVPVDKGLSTLEEIHARIDWANVMAGRVPLGDVEWAMVDAWAEDLNHPIRLTVTEP